MAGTCNPSFDVGSQLPHRVNNTYICGVNPYNSASLLQKCCQGPVTNITSPAPETGPYSDSWPLTCFAYCAILLKPYYSDQDSVVHNNFTSCLASDSSFFGSIVCTEVNGLAPNECAPFHESVGCTDSRTHQTWGVSGYISSSSATTTMGQSRAQQTTGVLAGSTSATNLGTSTAAPSASPTRSAAAPIWRRTEILKIVMASLVLQVYFFSLCAS